MDDSCLSTNGWLAGFTDADGNFSVSIRAKNKPSSRVELSYRLELRQNYTKINNINISNSYESILRDIAKLFDGGFYSRSRTLKLINQSEFKEYKSYIISAHSQDSLLLVRDYFTSYPLLSSKYLDFKDWAFVLNNKIENMEKEELLKLSEKIRLNYNSTRKVENLNFIENNILKY